MCRNARIYREKGVNLIFSMKKCNYSEQDEAFTAEFVRTDFVVQKSHQ